MIVHVINKASSEASDLETAGLVSGQKKKIGAGVHSYVCYVMLCYAMLC